MNLQLIALVVLIVFVAAFVQSAIGFGSALVSMPLLAPLIGFATATPLVGLVSLIVGPVVLLMDGRKMDFRSAWRIMVSSLVGVPFGLLLLQFAPESWVKAGLGVLLISYGLFNLLTKGLPEIKSKWLAFPFGFVSGVLGGAYNTNGPPLVIYGTLQRWPPEQFRATLQGAFFFSNFAILPGYALAGLWTQQVWLLFLCASPAVLLAVFIGRAVNARIPQKLFARVVYVLLIALGVLFLVR
jgi:hypothetical protein